MLATLFRRTVSLRSVVCLVGALATAVALTDVGMAHPSIIMSCRVLFDFDGPSVKAIGEEWTFDETFSRELVDDFDTNGNGTFSKDEVDALTGEVFGNLDESRYLTYVSVDGKDLGKIKPGAGNAVLHAGRVTLAFVMYLPKPVDPGKHAIQVEIKDPDFVVYATMADQQPVLFRGKRSDACSARLVDDKDNAYFGNLIVPQAVTLRCGQDGGAAGTRRHTHR